MNSPGTLGHLQAEEVADLGAGDEDRDAVRESDDDRARNEPDGGAQCRSRPG